MNLAKSFSLYTITTFLCAGLPFLLLPILTDYLSPKDYGVLSMFNAVTRLVLPFITLGGVYAVTVEYFKKNKKDFKGYFSSVMSLQIYAFFIFFLFFLIAGKEVGSFFGFPFYWLILIPFICLFSISEETLLSLVRNQGKPVLYSILRIIKVITELTLTLVFIIGLSMGWKGRILSSSIVLSIIFIVACLFYLNHDYLSFKKANKIDIKLALLFGLPLIPDQLGSFVLNISDRFFIAGMKDMSEVGLYSVGSQIGLVVLIFCQAFFLAFAPFQFKSMKEGSFESKIKIVQISWVFIMILIFVVVILHMVTPYIFLWLNKDYSSGQDFVFWIAMGYFFRGCYFLALQYFLFEKQTNIIMKLTVSAIVLNLVLNYFFIKVYSTIGAAYSTTLSYFILAITALIISNAIYPMPWAKGLKRVLTWD